jgi:hypothetical protein
VHGPEGVRFEVVTLAVAEEEGKATFVMPTLG